HERKGRPTGCAPASSSRSADHTTSPATTTSCTSAQAWLNNSGSYACCIACSSGDSRYCRVNSKQHAASLSATEASRRRATRYLVDGVVQPCALGCGLPCESLMTSAVQVTVLGSGDAFGSGGRLHSAYLVESAAATF